MASKQQNQPPLAPTHPLPVAGLPVRTNLRAGLGYDEVSDQFQALWDKLSNMAVGAAATLPSKRGTTTSAE